MSARGGDEEGSAAAETDVITHITEWGLAECAGLLRPPGRSTQRRNVAARMKRLGLRVDIVACDGSSAIGRLRGALLEERTGHDVLLTAYSRGAIPTCPRCAVLRDEALEGRLPQRS